MTELKTKPTKKTATSYIQSIKDRKRREDAKELLNIFKTVTKEKPVMWGSSIVGFGTYRYTYPSGREGEWMRTGFSVRAQNLTLYLMPGYTLNKYKKLLKKLGPHKTGKSCLYIKRLSDVHIPTLRTLIKESLKDLKKKYK
jgi:hypothetical protein